MKITVLTIAAGLAALSLQGQPYRVPRLSDGKPDLNGIWEVRANIDANLEGKIAGKNIIVDPPDGKIPYQPWAEGSSTSSLAG